MNCTILRTPIMSINFRFYDWDRFCCIEQLLFMCSLLLSDIKWYEHKCSSCLNGGRAIINFGRVRRLYYLVWCRRYNNLSQQSSEMKRRLLEFWIKKERDIMWCITTRRLKKENRSNIHQKFFNADVFVIWPRRK